MVASEKHAALNGLEKKLVKLMSKGATRAKWAEWLRAPLEHALATGDKRLALALLTAGADGAAERVGRKGRTLLGATAEGGHHELVSAVLEAGGLEGLDTVHGDNNMTALHHAVAGGHTKATRVLTLAGANAGLLDGRGRSVLHHAVQGGPLRLVRNVIGEGADVNATDAEDDTPLHLASAYGDKAIVSALLRKGASVSAANHLGQLPLHVAVMCDRVAVAESLLKAGADPNVLCRDDDSPLSFDDYRLASPLLLACDSLAMTRNLLKNGADLTVVDDLYGFTPLHGVARFGDADVVEELVEAGADVSARSYYHEQGALRNYSGLTPLHSAAWGCNLGGLSALLRHGANVNAVDGNDQTPLHWLCKNNAFGAHAVDAAELVLRWGADETLTDIKGNTPLQRIEEASATRRLRKLLANAPADRAWRRRGVLVMCRAFPDRMPKTGGKGRAGKAKARRGRGRGGGGSAGGGRGSGDVLTRVVELNDDEIFRTIVGFL